MLVSIIIPTCRREFALQRTLVSLGQHVPCTGSYEILVVSNGTPDTSADVVRKVHDWFPRLNIRHVHEDVPGLLAGRHRGIEETDGDIATFIDDDVEVAPTWLDSIIEAFHDPSVGLVGGPCLPLYFSRPPTWLDSFFLRNSDGGWTCCELSLLDWGRDECDIDAKMVFGLNFSMRRDLLLKLGGFHPDCLPQDLQKYQGDGETGLSAKLMESGGRSRYLPRAKVWHQVPPERMTIEYFKKRAFYQGVCDSYSALRQSYVAPIVKEPPRNPLLKCLRTIASSTKSWARRQIERTGIQSESETEVRLLVRQAYQAGFDFHRRQVTETPGLLEWVSRPNYLDCWLPVDACVSQDKPGTVAATNII
jgi:glycosyltransferase involved in cell wall biosynthesis